ncbi:MAG: hypothetical protein KJT03_20985, partial [Verrucomicrobiae bacterium]|nr:hypothetical protein [Verrucomicrobiae bacterium]
SATLDKMVKPLGGYFDKDKMKALGIRKTMKLAYQYNRFQWGRCEDHRRKLFKEHIDELLSGNDDSRLPGRFIEDGYYLDTSMSLPYLDELLEEGDRIINERSGRNERDARYRSFFRNIVPPNALPQYPTLLKFITSSAVIELVANYLRYIPCLSTWIPEGVRFVESGMEFDAESHLPPRDSQLYHIDPYCNPMVYVLVLMRETTLQNGPFTWMGAEASDKVKAAQGYWEKGHGYRLSDEQVYEVVGKEPENILTYPAGTTLFLDTSRCLHYGSRNCVEPRYQLMYGLMSPCRNDFSDSLKMDLHYDFPTNDSDSELRKLVLNKEYIVS